jgi:hypothetical protein
VSSITPSSWSEVRGAHRNQVNARSYTKLFRPGKKSPPPRVGSVLRLGRFVSEPAAEALPPCRTSLVGKMVPLSLIAVPLLSLLHILRDLIRPGKVLTSR